MSLLEIKAIFSGEKYRSGDFVIASARGVDEGSVKAVSGYFSIKGNAEPDELKQHQTYRFYGRWTKYKGEDQFTFQTFVQSQPHGQSGVVNYLIQAGKGRGIGHARATKIWDKFGSDAIRICKEEPEVIVAAIRGLKLADAEETAKWLKKREALEDATIEVTNLLDKKGFPKTLPRQVIKEWGNKAAEVIKADPFKLMMFTGCGFKRCDNLYLQMGLDPAKLRRQCYAAAHSISSNSDGSTWFPAQHVANAVQGAIVQGARPKTAIKMGIRIGNSDLNHHGAMAIVRENGGAIQDGGKNVWLAEGRKAWSEYAIAEIVAGYCNFYDDDFWPIAYDIKDISEHQQQELFKSLYGPFAILGGSPGTGKTYTAARVISAIADSIGLDNIATAAPTGKAAVRLTESMAEYGLGLRCRTWHSHLGVGENGQFAHDERNPWPYKLIVADESSMLDTNLFASILRAIPVGCHLLLIGDVNQLPPVGHGAPLRDLIAAGLPYGELTEIKRNSGGIVEACAAIRDKKPLPDDPGNLIWRPVEASHQIDCALDTIWAANEAGFDPIWDCQTLVAVNEKSPVSRKAVNQVLQAELNPSPKVEGSAFRLNDKVVNLQNMGFPLIEDAAGPAEKDTKAYVANGELGKVIEIEPKYFTVSLESPYRKIRVPRGKSKDGGTGCSWDLGYALSCHKSQGSEWPVVIVMLDEYPGAKRVCSREWLYTGISRAKEKCFLIGKRSVANEMCSRTAIDKRKTFLKERIRSNLANLEMAGM